jgi:DnaJ-class molecular chaperone
VAAADHYSTLQVSRDAESEVIEKAYRVLALKYHPDTSRDSRTSHRMQRINEAFAVLSDPIRRTRYDATLVGDSLQRSGWEVFWDVGLVGLYREHRRRSVGM